QVPRGGREARGRADGRARARLRGSRTMASYANTRPEVRVDAARTLPARYYTDAAWFERELEAIHYDMWLRAGRLEELDAPGRYFVRAFGNASVIVLRDENGGLRALRTPLPSPLRPAGPRAPRGTRGHARGPAPVPVPRVDLRPRRVASKRAAHGQGRGLPGGGLSARARGRDVVGRPRLHQPVPGSGAARRA